MRLSFPSGEILSSSYTPFTLKCRAVGGKRQNQVEGEGVFSGQSEFSMNTKRQSE